MASPNQDLKVFRDRQAADADADGSEDVETSFGTKVVALYFVPITDRVPPKSILWTKKWKSELSL